MQSTRRNIACASESRPPVADAETVRPPHTRVNRRQSVATHVTFGNFRLIDLGDLNWDQERNLVCPDNLLGSVDVYVTTAHGQQISGPEVLVHALRPRAIVMNNALKKGGDSPTMAVLRSSPGADVWQLHFSLLSSKAENAPDAFIANVGEVDTGNWIKLSARPDGSFVVTNSRGNFTRAYSAPAQASPDRP